MKRRLLPITALSLFLGRSLAQPSPSRQHLEDCRSNLGVLGTACEVYRSDWGFYPPRLKQLTLKGRNTGYLKAIPTCPAAGSDTYSQTYRMRRSHFDEDHKYKGGIDFFIIYCGGHQHTWVQPGYDCRRGLVFKRPAP